MPPADDEMQRYYASRASEYDSVYLKPERQADLRSMERWLPPIFTGARVLEIACGTGYWTQFIAQLAGSVVGIDAAIETIRIAKRRVPASKVQFLVGDAYALPCSAAAFDAAFAGFWFSHVPKARRREFLLHMNEALRPGARVVLIDNAYVEGSSSPVTAHDRDGNAYQTRYLADGTTHQVLKNFPSEAEMQDAVDGLARESRCTRWSYFWAFEYVVAAPSRTAGR